MIRIYSLGASLVLLALTSAQGPGPGAIQGQNQGQGPPGTQSDIEIDFESLYACQNATFTWTGGTPPYDIYLYEAIPSNFVDGSPTDFKHLGPVDTASVQWFVDMPQGTQIVVNVRDANHPNYDGSAVRKSILTVNHSDDESCVADRSASSSNDPTLASSVTSAFSTYTDGAVTGSAVSSAEAETTSSPSTTAADATSQAAAVPTESDSGNGALPMLQWSRLWVAVPVIGLLAAAL